jgi:ribonuclease BN (tRNA processing enzyme)
MMRAGVRFTIQGTRSSVPRSCAGPFGIHTTCFTLETPRQTLVIDAGTGIFRAEELLASAGTRAATFLFTHGHFDHLLGLPSHPALYARTGRRIRVLASPAQLPRVRRAVRTLLSPPLWPVPWRVSGARLRFDALPPAGQPWRVGPARLRWCPVWHPQGCLALRIETRRGALVVGTDREGGNPFFDRKFEAFARGADWLILDAQYTPEEAATRRGWGHGNWREAASLAKRCGVGQLVLTHHDDHREPSAIRAIVRQARRIFPRTVAATAGMAFVF